MAGPRPAHLGRRGAVYFVRFRLPVDLATRLGMVELRRSLQTREPYRARLECLKAAVWFRETVERLREMPNPSRGDLEEAARTYFSLLSVDLDRPRNMPGEPAELDCHLDYQAHLREERTAALEQQLVENQYDGRVEGHATALIAPLGLNYADLSEQEKIQACRLAVRAELAQSELYRHQTTDPLRPFEPTDELFRTPPRPSLPSAYHNALDDYRSGRSLSEVASLFTAMKRAKGITQHQITELDRAFSWLQEVAGADTDIRRVSRELLRKFRTNLTRVDVRLRGRKLPFQARLTDEADHQIQFQTASRYWRSTQALFAWAMSEGLRDDDPAASLRLERPKFLNQRSPESFSQEELRRLFTTPLFAGYKGPKRVSTPGSRVARDGHWWFVVLAMHSGACAGELSQLLPSDFVFDAEVPHWKIRREDAEGRTTKSVKNTASVRDVPIHPRLLELGLREFVEERAKRFPNDRLLRELRLGTRGRHSAGASRFFADYLKKFGLHKEGRATHVWRHTVTDCLLRNSVAEEDIAAFVGHAPRSQTGKYGSGQPLTRKLRTALKLDYGFDLVAAVGGPYVRSKHRS